MRRLIDSDSIPYDSGMNLTWSLVSGMESCEVNEALVVEGERWEVGGRYDLFVTGYHISYLQRYSSQVESHGLLSYAMLECMQNQCVSQKVTNIALEKSGTTCFNRGG